MTKKLGMKEFKESDFGIEANENHFLGVSFREIDPPRPVLDTDTPSSSPVLRKIDAARAKILTLSLTGKTLSKRRCCIAESRRWE